MRLKPYFLIVVAMAIAAGPAGAIPYSALDRSKIDSATLEELLSEGPMILAKEDGAGNLLLVTSAILVDAPPEQVFAAISDFEHFPEFMPSTEEVNVVSRAGNDVKVWFHIKFSFSILSYTVKYTLDHHVVPGTGVWWELDSGDLNRAVGSWEVIPVSGGEKTAAVYSVYTDIRSIGRVVAYFLDKEPSMDVAINSSTCVLVLKAVRDRVESGVYEGAAPLDKNGEPAADAEADGAPAESAEEKPTDMETEEDARLLDPDEDLPDAEPAEEQGPGAP